MNNNKFISNNSNSNHLEYILQNFEEADEIWMATAFLKMSGLNLLLPAIKKHIKQDKKITIIAGQNFGLTEPDALRALFNLFTDKVNANIFLDKADDKNLVFHSKLFLFKNNISGTIISGSANITKGGLVTNNESSLMSSSKITDPDWKDATKYFEQIISFNNANSLNLMLIERYSKFYNEQRKARANQKVAPEKNDRDYSFDYKKLKKRLKEYKTEKNKLDFKQREKDYLEAKKLLEEIATSPKLTQVRFEDIIDTLVGKKGQSGLWKSGSLLRLRHQVYDCKNEFRSLVKFVKENQKALPSKVFDKARKLVDEIDGARVNYVTEIMITFQPNKFANLNSNPIIVLKEEAGVIYKSHSSSFNGVDYEKYCLLISEIANELDLKNMLEVDSFFNDIYWNLKKENI